MPLAPPVTTATLPLSLPISRLSCLHGSDLHRRSGHADAQDALGFALEARRNCRPSGRVAATLLVAEATHDMAAADRLGRRHRRRGSAR